MMAPSMALRLLLLGSDCLYGRWSRRCHVITIIIDTARRSLERRQTTTQHIANVNASSHTDTDGLHFHLWLPICYRCVSCLLCLASYSAEEVHLASFTKWTLRRRPSDNWLSNRKTNNSNINSNWRHCQDNNSYKQTNQLFSFDEWHCFLTDWNVMKSLECSLASRGPLARQLDPITSTCRVFALSVVSVRPLTCKYITQQTKWHFNSIWIATCISSVYSSITAIHTLSQADVPLSLYSSSFQSYLFSLSVINNTNCGPHTA